ncbi:MAG: hypothetical protein ABSA77_11550 [Thermoguttaceae bacterium]
MGCTGETGEPTQSGTINSAWWSWTAPSAGQLTIDTFGSDFDTFLTLATGSAVNTLTVLAQNDDSGGGLQSSITWSVTAGTQYQISVDGFSTYTGNITLNLSLVTPPVNDNFANRTPITGTLATITATNVGATKESGEPNHAGNAGGKSVWWTWTAPSAGSVLIDTIGSNFDTILGVYTGSSVSTLTTVASDDDSGGNLTSLVTFNVVSGTSYQIAVDGYGGASGNISLFLDLTTITRTWGGGSLVNNLWSTPANWDGNVAPLAGDNLVFPSGAKQLESVNDYPSTTVFGSITVSGSGYSFSNGITTSTSVTVESGGTLVADSIVTDTLTIGGGTTETSSPISTESSSQSTVSAVAVGSETSKVDTAAASIDLTSSVTAQESALDPTPIVITQATALIVSPVDNNPAITATTSSNIIEEPLPAETIDTSPAPAPVAINLPLSAKPVEILPGRESSAKIRDFLFSQPEQGVLFPTALTNSLSNDATVRSPGSESGKVSNTSLVFDSVSGRKSFFPQSIISITSARDTALQQTLHEDLLADWLWSDDLETIKKRQKGNFSNTMHLAWGLV